jgi:SAM-dependent methyltransferase
MATKFLFVASEVGLFPALADGPASLEELAERTGVPLRTLRMVADAVVALGLLEHHDDRYQNAPVAARYLAGQSADDLGPFLRFWNRFSYPAWQHLEAAVRGDQPAPRSGPASASDQAVISQGIAASTRRAAQALAERYDFGAHQRVLDAGGGTGSMLLAILARYPTLTGTLFELPPVTAVATEQLSRHALGDRIQVEAGDFLVDPLPAEHDAILLANVVHLFTPERNQILLRRLREAVTSGARLLLVDRWTDETHTGPLSAALAAGEYLLAVGGDVYSSDEGRDWLAATGWQAGDHRLLADGWSLLIGEAR